MSTVQDRVIRLLFAHRSKILAYIWSIVRDFDVAEDVFQDVSVLALQKAATIQDETHFHGWVRASSRLISLATLRRLGQAPLPLDSALLDQLDQAWASNQAGPAQEGIEALHGCLKQLSQHSRRIIELRYRKGLVGKALADALGRSVNTVYVALSRTHHSLKECVRRQLAQAAQGASGE